VVIVRIADAGYTGDRFMSWEATAHAEQVLRGSTELRVFEFGRVKSPGACDDGLGLPNVGEIWVLYVHNLDHPEIRDWVSSGFGQLVRDSFPISIARDADPWLARRTTGSDFQN
jgi:hypothetical protein